MASKGGNGSASSSENAGVEAFVWRQQEESTSGGSNSSSSSSGCWTIRHRKSSRIYDSDPHSLQIPRSHNAWKKELMMTRFANQELPEALWGDNFLEICYTARTDPPPQPQPQECLRISFCALEALRTWALMDMDVALEENVDNGESSDPKDGNEETNLPTIIPHKSGRTPDRWDYTYTTNYSGSVEYVRNGVSSGSFDAKQPNRTTLYGIKVLPTDTASTTKVLNSSSSASVGGNSTTPTVELRPPLCKCVGGRMICAGVAQTIATQSPFPKSPIRLSPKLQFSKPPLPSINTVSATKLPTVSNSQAPMPPPKASPKWMPYCRETDGPFDMEGLLNSQRSPPLHYTGTIPFWIQNLDPQSYSFLTATAVVCGSGGSSNGNLYEGGFLAVLLRCFVRVNGVRVRLIDTKYIIRRRRKLEKSNHKGTSQLPPMVVLRERSWKEGSWKDYTAGMKGATSGGSYHFLGTDLEQGRRASKTLPDKFPPILDKLVLCDDGEEERENEFSNDCNGSGNSSSNYHQESNGSVKEEWKVPVLHGKSISNCASESGILVSVVDECKLVAHDLLSGDFLWEHNMTSSSVLSLVVNLDQKIAVGDDRGCVHIVEWSAVSDAKGKGNSMISKQSYCFEAKNEGNRRNVQRSSNWVEIVAWSSCGCHFAAAAGKKIMINGKVIEMEGTVYGVAFFPTSPNSETRGETTNDEENCGSMAVRQLLAIALYGGLTIVDAVTMAVSHRQFTVGSSAVLSFAISPNGRSIGIGCLDKRLRVLGMAKPAIANESNDLGRNEIGSWDARDWIGLDGGVVRVAFGPDNRRIAALGGSILIVIDRTAEWGEAPILCLMHHQSHEENGRKGDRFLSFAWSTKDLLVASTTDRFLHVFDVRATIDTIPKRSYPIDSIPIEKGFLVTDTDGEIVLWGKSGIRKINVSK